MQAAANQVGEATGQLIARLLKDPDYHPRQRERSALGIVRLAEQATPQLLEQAAKKALAIHATSYRLLEALVNELQAASDSQPPTMTMTHENIRGQDDFC